MRALNSVMAAMLVVRQSISSSIFLKSFFIFLMVSGEDEQGKIYHGQNHNVQYLQ